MAFDHLKIEKKWQDYWLAHKTFKTVTNLKHLKIDRHSTADFSNEKGSSSTFRPSRISDLICFK